MTCNPIALKIPYEMFPFEFASNLVTFVLKIEFIR